MIVLDASAAVEFLLQTAAGVRMERRLFSGRSTLHAPYLLDVEIAQVLRRFVGRGLITEARGRQALEDLSDLALSRYPHGPLLGRVWQLRDNLTAYDATYVALAEALEAPLITCDKKIASAPHHHARVELV